MLFSQVLIFRRATRSNLANPYTFPLENPRGSNSGLRNSFVCCMSLYEDYGKLNEFLDIFIFQFLYATF